MKQLFKQSAKDWFEQQQLNEEKLDNFRTLLGEHKIDESNIALDESSSKFNRLVRFQYLLSAMAICLIVAIGIVHFSKYETMSLRIADEVAKNHIKMKPLEVETQEFDVLREYFTELDFSIAHSNVFEKSNNTMLGARYCSIQGITAAQLRYQNKVGDKITLYEVQYDVDVFGLLPKVELNETPLDVLVRGLNVSIWVENGLLMVAAKEVP